MKIIGITGLTGAGKSAIVKYVNEKYNFPVIKIGDLIRENLIKKNINPDARNCIIISNQFKKRKKSLGTLAVKKLREFKKRNIKFVILDALRGKYDISFYRKFADRVVIIAVFASQNIRFERTLKRGRDGDSKNFESFKKWDLWQFNFGVSKLFTFADFIIDTTFSKKWHKTVDKIIKKIKDSENGA